MLNRASRLLDRQLPHRQVPPNPLLEYELRKLGDNCSEVKLSAYSLSAIKALLLIAALGGPLWLLLDSITRHYDNSTFAERTASTFAGLGFIAVALGLPYTLITDCHYMLTTVHSISRNIETGLWEMLRLTPLSESHLIGAKYAVAQARLWQVMISSTAIHALSVMLWSIALMAQLVAPGPYSNYGARSILLVLVSSAIISTGWVAEPFWRMRAFVAAALAISAYRSTGMLSDLVGILSVVGLRVVQIALISSVSLLLFSFLALGPDVMDDAQNQASFVLVPLLLLIIGVVVYGFYRVVAALSLKLAATIAFRSE